MDVSDFLSLSDISLDISDEFTESDQSVSTNVKPKINRSKLMQELFKLFIRHKLTLKALEDAAKLINLMPGAIFKLPTTKFLLMKELFSATNLNMNQHFFCEKCEIYIEFNLLEHKKSMCKMCNTKFKKGNFFIYINLKEQITSVIEQNFGKISEYLESVTNETDITDIYSSEYTKNLLRENKNIYTVMLNTDGVSTVRANTSSLWPILLICNFLPPSIRFKDENIIVVALYHGEKKPNIHELFKPLVKEFVELSAKGVFVRDKYYNIFITNATLDLPAKSSISQVKQYNGRQACNYCLQEGQTIAKKGIRYTYDKHESPLRTHEMMIEDMSIVSSNPNRMSHGVKGISPMIAFTHFNMAKSFCIDYMHAVLLGILENLLSFWTKSCFKKQSYYITKKKREVLNMRLIKIKTPTFISRRPRSLDHLKLFKASEMRNLLIYYLPVCIKGLLPGKFIRHFNLLSSSIYTLLKPSISNNELNDTEMKLKIFVEDYENYYGKVNMTMNIHSILHFVECVRNFGPLWCYSMFPFESYNGLLKSFIVAPTDILFQISTRYAGYKIVISDKNKNNDEYFAAGVLKCEKKLTPEAHQMEAIEEADFPLNEDLIFFACLEKNGTVFTSKSYTKATKTIDYFITTTDGIIGAVQFYVLINFKPYAVIEQLDVDEVLNQIKKIHFTEKYTVIKTDKINDRCIYIAAAKQHYIVERPNPYERN